MSIDKGISWNISRAQIVFFYSLLERKHICLKPIFQWMNTLAIVLIWTRLVIATFRIKHHTSNKFRKLESPWLYFSFSYRGFPSNTANSACRLLTLFCSVTVGRSNLKWRHPSVSFWWLLTSKCSCGFFLPSRQQTDVSISLANITELFGCWLRIF